MNEDLSVSDASEIIRITKQAVRFAIKAKRLKANICNNQWKIKQDDMLDYLQNRWKIRRNNGIPIFGENEFSINEVAKRSSVPIQRIYYLIRKKFISPKRIKSAYIFDTNEMDRIVEMEEFRRNLKKTIDVKSIKKQKINHKKLKFRRIRLRTAKCL